MGPLTATAPTIMTWNGFDMPKVRGVRRLGLQLPFPTMPKTTRTYWNPLSDEHRGDWQPIEGLEGMAEELKALKKGRYVLVPVDEPPALTEEQEAGLEAALASVRAGEGLSRAEAYAKAKASLE